MSRNKSRIPTFSSFGDNFQSPDTRNLSDVGANDASTSHYNHSSQHFEDEFGYNYNGSEVVETSENFQISIENDRARGKCRRITRSSSFENSTDRMNLVINISRDQRSKRFISDHVEEPESYNNQRGHYKERKYHSKSNSRLSNETDEDYDRYNYYDGSRYRDRKHRMSRHNSYSNERSYRPLERSCHSQSPDPQVRHESSESGTLCDTRHRSDRGIIMPVSQHRDTENRMYNKQRRTPVHSNEEFPRQTKQFTSRYSPEHQARNEDNMQHIMLDHSRKKKSDAYEDRINRLVKVIGPDNLMNIAKMLEEKLVDQEARRPRSLHHKDSSFESSRQNDTDFNRRSRNAKSSGENHFDKNENFEYIQCSEYNRDVKVMDVDCHRSYDKRELYKKANSMPNHSSQMVHDLLSDSFKNKIAEDTLENTKAMVAKLLPQFSDEQSTHSGKKRKLSPQNDTVIPRNRLGSPSYSSDPVIFRPDQYQDRTHLPQSCSSSNRSNYADNFSKTAELYKSKWIKKDSEQEAVEARNDNVSIDKYTRQSEKEYARQPDNDETQANLDLSDILTMGMIAGASCDETTLKQINLIKGYLQEKLNSKFKVDIGKLPSKSKKRRRQY